MGLTQEKLAEALGITFQQIQKYEKGTTGWAQAVCTM
jgi:transcriptional regulator with XRE-family HTH domain